MFPLFGIPNADRHLLLLEIQKRFGGKNKAYTLFGDFMKENNINYYGPGHDIMKGLGKIIATPKYGNEAVSSNGINTGYTLIDFWRWSSSDLVSNTIRGLLAEFIVGTAIKFDPGIPRQEWEAFDLIIDNRIRIEVKSSAYIQSWNQKKLSRILFSIKPSKYWDTSTGIESEKRRHSDVYVFCHLKHTDQETINPLKTEQWDFYVLSTKILNELMPGKGSISLEVLRDLTSPVMYCNLYETIITAYQIIGKSI